MDRRSFLGKAVAAGAITTIGAAGLGSCKKELDNEALGLPPLLDRAPDGKKLKAGLVGCGNRGTGAALDFVAAGADLEIIALADVFDDKVKECRQKLANGKVEVPLKNCFSGFDAYKKLLETDVDVVILATPPHFRPEQLKACVTAKKHVFMEKPASVDPVGARSVMASSKKAESLGLTIITGTQRRHQRDYVETYKRVANGAIGDFISARAWWMQSHVWFRTREKGWNDMEYMIRNWNNFCWLCGDHILDTHVHNIDIINWFTGKHPVSAIGFGGRHRRLTGDQYDFFNVDFDYGDAFHSQSTTRQIDGCENGIGEIIMGSEGYTNCENTIFYPDGTVKWKYEYPLNANGVSSGVVKVSPYVQEHIHLATAIRTNNPVQEAERTAISTLTAIMGRISAYTGKKITWDEMMNSTLKLGPEEYKLGDVEMEIKVPEPGIQHKGT